MSESDGYHDLERDVTPHVVDAATTGNHVLVGIFQPAQVVLVGLVQQVVGGDVELSYLLAFHLYVRSCRKAEQAVAGRLGLCVIGTVDMRLLQVAIKSGSDVEVV